MKCTRCEGCGRIANSDDGEPWTVWEALPPGSDLAVRAGLVRPITCPVCKGTKEVPDPATIVVKPLEQPMPGTTVDRAELVSEKNVLHDDLPPVTPKELAADLHEFFRTRYKGRRLCVDLPEALATMRETPPGRQATAAVHKELFQLRKEVEFLAGLAKRGRAVLKEQTQLMVDQASFVENRLEPYWKEGREILLDLNRLYMGLLAELGRSPDSEPGWKQIERAVDWLERDSAPWPEQAQAEGGSDGS